MWGPDCSGHAGGCSSLFVSAGRLFLANMSGSQLSGGSPEKALFLALANGDMAAARSLLDSGVDVRVIFKSKKQQKPEW